LISMNVTKLVDSRENILSQSFNTLCPAVFVKRGAKIIRNCIFCHAASNEHYHNFSSVQATALIWSLFES
jgi:hypothetical protein